MTGLLAAVILSCGLICLCCYFHFRRRFVRLSSDLCRYAESIMRGEPVQSQQNQETLTSKVVMEQQLIKLEFLLDTLLKASRLETDMIQLEMKNRRILETLAAAVNNIMHRAELKHIGISVECRSSIQVCHDRRWTAEALENILDNAVKYTPENGSIRISVHTGELYTEIRIRDTGYGKRHRTRPYQRHFQTVLQGKKCLPGRRAGIGSVSGKIYHHPVEWVYRRAVCAGERKLLLCLPPEPK